MLDLVAYLALLLLILLASWALTGVIRRYALAKSLIDIPNNRSSHSVPVPRGGGLAVVLVTFVAFVALWFVGKIDFHFMLAMLGGGGIVALIGFMDDHGHIAARWRLLAHFFGAVWVLVCLGGFPPLSFFYGELDLGWLGAVIAVVYLVWLLNLYNFMDGINGIASIEAITVCVGALVVSLLVLPDGSYSILMLLVLIAACFGFLIWNFPKAKIFMGDACSGFLGLMLGVFSIQAAWLEADLFWCWLILLGVFIVDATLTLVRRVLRGDKFYEAHRSHAYQFAARRYSSHAKVTFGVALINLLWLFPCAVMVVLGWIDGLLGVALAYAPLVLLAWFYGAGTTEQPDIRPD